MTLDATHLVYPHRRYGMDHDRYDWSLLQRRPAVRWPGDKPLAVWINVSLQHFPLDPRAGIRLPGSMSTPYPDLRHFTLRDHGNRVGAWRLLDALAEAGLTASFAINAALAGRCPELMLAIRESGAEVLGHSWNMDSVHAGDLDEATERELIRRSLGALQATFKREIAGWLSPGRLETARTPELLHEAGIRYFADWVNDELPYTFRTAHGPLCALPLPSEIEDRFVVLDNLHAESSWADQVIDAFDYQLEEAVATGAGRLFSLSLHAWVTGQAHRVKHLRRILAHIAAARQQVWLAQPGEIVAAVQG